jgi:hypothetical protein
MLDDVADGDTDKQSAIVQMLDGELPPTQRGEQVNLDLRDQIIILPFEPLMRFLVNDNGHIPGLSSRCLIALAPKHDRLPALHALVDMYLQKLLLGHGLFPFTCPTSILGIDDLPHARTLVALRLDLLYHGTDLSQLHADTAAVARRTGLCSALFATPSFAFRADHVPRERQFGRFALVEIFECDAHAVNEVFGPSYAWLTSASAKEGVSSAESTTKELAEEILVTCSVCERQRTLYTYLGIHASQPALFVQTGLATRVVYTPLLWIREDFVSGAKLRKAGDVCAVRTHERLL